MPAADPNRDFKSFLYVSVCSRIFEQPHNGEMLFLPEYAYVLPSRRGLFGIVLNAPLSRGVLPGFPNWSAASRVS
jgi:hypothetical protein